MLSVSEYSKQLILKGGAFIYAMQGLKSRPTIDVDLLGTQISNDIDVLCEVFRQICAVESEDEVVFNQESVVGELITQQDKYNGVRLYIDATFHTVRQRIQIDVGFGDIVIPVVQELEYPILLAICSLNLPLLPLSVLVEWPVVLVRSLSTKEVVCFSIIV